MRRDTKVQFGALAVMGLCMAGSGVLAVNLSAQQARHKLVYTTTAVEGQPPQVAVGIAMGAFRGVFVNWLWMRANELKEAGRYHESVELAKAITTLQPRFPRAWTFHAWNLAYNISVTTQTAGERWNWVMQGIDLLRGPALKYNPNDLLIHKELAWIFLHKVQGVTDDANIFYKKMLAKEWQVVLGAPPTYDPAVRGRDQDVKRFVAWLSPVADAPGTLDGLYAGPDGEAVRALVGRIREKYTGDFGYAFLEQYEVDRAMAGSGRRSAIEAVFKPGEKTRALIEDPAFAKAWPRLLAYARAKLLRERYNMDPSVMVRFTEKYGPIDWRHPAAHALYWAALGVENALPRSEARNARDYDFVNTDRVVIQSVQELYRSGLIYIDFLALELDPSAQGFYLGVVEPNFVDTYGQILEELRSRSGVDNLFERGWSFYSAGYDNFLRDAVRYYYRRGDRNTAEKYRTILRTYDGQNVNDPDRNDILSLPLDEFIEKELWDRQTSPYVAVSEINGSIEGAVLALVDQDPDRFTAQMDYARKFFKYYMDKQNRSTVVSPDNRMAQMGADFNDFAGTNYSLIIQRLPFDQAVNAYAGAPDWLRQYAYDFLKQLWAEVLKKEEGVGGKKFEQLFPEPLGMDVFRAEQERKAKQAEAQRGRPSTDLK